MSQRTVERWEARNLPCRNPKPNLVSSPNMCPSATTAPSSTCCPATTGGTAAGPFADRRTLIVVPQVGLNQLGAHLNQPASSSWAGASWGPGEKGVEGRLSVLRIAVLGAVALQGLLAVLA